MELKILIKNTYYLASTRAVKFILGLIRAKLSAIFLGTTGIGILSQIIFTSNQIKAVTLLEMQHGFVKQVSSKKKSKDFRYQLINSLKAYLILISIFTIIIFLVSLLYSEKLTIYFFGDSIYFKYYLISIISLPILIINSIPFALLKSFKEIKSIARAQLFSIIISFLCFIPMVYYFQLMGAAIVFIITLIITLFFNHIYVKNKILSKYSISYRDIFSKGILLKTNIKELLVFAGWGMTIGIYYIFSVIYGRSIVINELGIASLGLYAPNKAWGALFTGISTQQLHTYLFPRFAESKSDDEINGVLNDTFRLVTFMLIPMLFIGIAFRNIIIPLFYSYEFVEAANYLPGHFIGIMFTMWMYALGQVFAPTGRLKIYVLFTFIMYTINIALLYYLVPLLGLYGWMLKFIVTPVLFFFIFSIYLKQAIGFTIKRENLLVMFYALLSSLMLFGITEWNELAGYILSLFLLFFSWFLLSFGERSQITEKIKLFFNKLKLY